MDFTLNTLLKRAYATPSLRQNICNKGMIYLYCDYSGQVEQMECGVACCFVYNRSISVTAEKRLVMHAGGSNYGELLAIHYSLNVLNQALEEYRPKFAILYTDCSCIGRLLLNSSLAKPLYGEVRNDILCSLNDLRVRFPEVEVQIKYISKHKKNNALHRMAHNAARKAIGK